MATWGDFQSMQGLVLGQDLSQGSQYYILQGQEQHSPNS